MSSMSESDVEKGLDEVLQWWFAPGEGRVARWFVKNDQVDREIETKFSSLHDKVSNLSEAPVTPQRRLAAIIVLDQLSRNLYRGDAKAFAWDDMALRWCQEGVAAGIDQKLNLVEERAFFYIPCEHSEDAGVQKESVRLMGSLADIAKSDEEKKMAQAFLSSAKEHFGIIERFGRYPHRNEVLGRESTPEELEYLKSAERFGQ